VRERERERERTRLNRVKHVYSRTIRRPVRRSADSCYDETDPYHIFN